MKFELRKYNIDKVKEALKGVGGKDIMINDTSLYGVTSIDIQAGEVYCDEPIPEQDYDGGKHDEITLRFHFKDGGYAAHSFEPDMEVCTIIFETDELWIVCIEDMKKYIQREQSDLELRLKDYEGFIAG